MKMFIVLAYVCASTFDSYAYEISCKRKLPLIQPKSATEYVLLQLHLDVESRVEKTRMLFRDSLKPT